MGIEIEYGPGGVTYHCGHCGQPVDSDGAHLDETAEPHAEPMAVVDDWPTEDRRPNGEDD